MNIQNGEGERERGREEEREKEWGGGKLLYILIETWTQQCFSIYTENSITIIIISQAFYCSY